MLGGINMAQLGKGPPRSRLEVFLQWPHVPNQGKLPSWRTCVLTWRGMGSTMLKHPRHATLISTPRNHSRRTRLCHITTTNEGEWRTAQYVGAPTILGLSAKEKEVTGTAASILGFQRYKQKNQLHFLTRKQN